jgi:general secretion pathway protein G
MRINQKRSARGNAAGFTLAELMVVIAIVAVLATTVSVYVFGALDDADQAKAQAEIKAMKSAVVQYMLKNNRQLPEQLEQIAPYMDPPKIPDDPWGNQYLYTKEGSREFTIVSYGADGRPGGEGIDKDISSQD